VSRPRSKRWLRAPKAGGSAEDGGPTASYFDIPVIAQPTMFLFDMSGGMREAVSRSNPRIRAELACDELGKTLKQLPEGTLFDMLIYRYYSSFPIRTEVQRPFSKGAQPANGRNIEAALKWFSEQPGLGWGAFYEGFAAAMEDPRFQAVYSISDGAPNRGEYVDRGELIDALAELRRFQPATVHAVLVGGGGRDLDFTQGVAESCGGMIADARARK
jgi:hypothetical protein